jgi:hypothetical protein
MADRMQTAVFTYRIVLVIELETLLIDFSDLSDIVAFF